MLHLANKAQIDGGLGRATGRFITSSEIFIVLPMQACLLPCRLLLHFGRVQRDEDDCIAIVNESRTG